MVLESPPERFPETETYLVDYWAREIGVTSTRFRQAIRELNTGTEVNVKRIKKHIAKGYRVTIRGADGVNRCVAKILLYKRCPQDFAVMIPHPSRHGWLSTTPCDYSPGVSTIPLSLLDNYKVNSRAKLSFHMDGFIQFSTGEDGPIISGYNPELHQVKGCGVKSDQPVLVTTGPLFGVQIRGLDEFPPYEKSAQLFTDSDCWKHPYYSGQAYQLDAFMISSSVLGQSRLVGIDRSISLELPLSSKIDFLFDVRVLEIPNSSYFLGLILHRSPSAYSTSGYTLGGPGYESPRGSRVIRVLSATYPCPDIPFESVTSLDYAPQS